MKKVLLSIIIFTASIIRSNACGWYDPDYEYFNLFSQEIITAKEYTPFLLTYSDPYYETDYSQIPDENIEMWQQYFDNKYSYEETKALVNLVDIKHLYNLQNGKVTHDLLKKLGSNPYTQYKDGVDYLIQAKYMEPYMRIKYVESGNNYYYYRDTSALDATHLNYTKTVAALNSLYNATKDKNIKMRYGYQLVRFNHYTRNFKAAIDAFNKYVAPFNTKNAVYYMALDQMAGAQRGLKMKGDADWNFFQVFMHSKNRKESAFNSIKLSGKADLKNLLSRAKTKEEQNMAYFLLAYNDYTNPVGIMKKMMQNNANSEILQVLAARAINQLERSYLPIYVPCNDANCDKKSKRLPVYEQADNLFSDKVSVDFLKEMEQIILEISKKSDDNFWNIADAYIKFLKKDYKQSESILSAIQTNDIAYKEQIQRMQMLNDIVSQPTIDEAFENILYSKYGDFFQKNESQNYYGSYPTTPDFLKDILANRYLLQNEHAKSFLMHNTLSDLQYNPNFTLTKQLEEFYNKQNKNNFEKLIATNIDEVGNAAAFFNVIYGDRAMRLADFEKAKVHYNNAVHFSGIPRREYIYNDSSYTIIIKKYGKDQYNGFNNISSLVFGHNVWESFQSAPEISMDEADVSSFSFIKNRMNKAELADALIQLANIGKNKNDLRAAYANQLIGNVLYNTSVLGYYRELFVMDVNNENSSKFHLGNNLTTSHYYYKNFYSNSFIEPDNFDVALGYYQKAFDLAKDKEQKARILFQMASAEQGKFYQDFAKRKNTTNLSSLYLTEKDQAEWTALRKSKYSKYFSLIRKGYADTRTVKDLRGSCTYLNYFM